MTDEVQKAENTIAVKKQLINNTVCNRNFTRVIGGKIECGIYHFAVI